jgi:hypothetical protein
VVRFRVPDSDHIVDADVWCDRNVAGEIEMHHHWDQFIQRHQVVGCDQWGMQNEHKNVFLWPRDVRGFDKEEVGRFVDEREHFTSCTTSLT